MRYAAWSSKWRLVKAYVMLLAYLCISGYLFAKMLAALCNAPVKLVNKLETTDARLRHIRNANAMEELAALQNISFSSISPVVRKKFPPFRPAAGWSRCAGEEDNDCLPNVVLFGAGDASLNLAMWLDVHPGIKFVGGSPQSGNYSYFGIFSKDTVVEDNEEIRREHLATKTASGSDLVIDFSPQYYASQEVPYRICSMLPCQDEKLKYIVVLKDPVRNVIESWAAAQALKGGKTLPYETLGYVIVDGIRESQKRGICFADGIRHGASGEVLDLQLCQVEQMWAENHKIWKGVVAEDFIRESEYYMNLWRWFRLVPRANIKVVRYEDLMAQPEQVMLEVLLHVGLGGAIPPRWNQIGQQILSESQSKRAGDHDPEALVRISHKRSLARHFQPHNKLLNSLLGYQAVRFQLLHLLVVVRLADFSNYFVFFQYPDSADYVKLQYHHTSERAK
jgi:hypothetical protein